MMRLIAILCLTGCAQQHGYDHHYHRAAIKSNPKPSVEASKRIYEISDESQKQ